MLKEFLQKHTHLSVKFSYVGGLNNHWTPSNYWVIQVFNNTFDLCTPIFEYTMTAEELDKLNVDFETALITPIVNWWDNRHKKEELS